jgi:hypothetical protein
MSSRRRSDAIHGDGQVHGPFIEVKELIGGYAIVQAGSKEEAIELANRVADVHIDAGVAEIDMEIRPLFDPDCSARNS